MPSKASGSACFFNNTQALCKIMQQMCSCHVKRQLQGASSLLQAPVLSRYIGALIA